MQLIDAIFFIVIGYAIGRAVGHVVYMRSEKEWIASVERLGAIERKFQSARVPFPSDKDIQSNIKDAAL